MNIKKSIVTALLIGSIALLSGCAGERNINGKTYPPYGLCNENARKVEGVTYEVSAGSVICAIIFSETVIVPVYVVGWDLFEPVAEKPIANKK